MVTVTNHKTTQVNFVLIPNNPISIDGIDITKLKSKLSDIFENSKTIITQFPEMIIIFDPNNRITLNILKDQNRIIIADNTITPYSGRPLSNFFKFVKEAVDIINNNKMKDYGFNIFSNFDLDNGLDDSGQFIKDNYIDAEKFSSIGTLKSAGLKLIYQTDSSGEGIRFDLKIEPKFGPKLEPTKSMTINHNSHFAGKSLPDLTDLQSQCQEIYNNLPGSLEKIFLV